MNRRVSWSSRRGGSHRTSAVVRSGTLATAIMLFPTSAHTGPSLEPQSPLTPQRQSSAHSTVGATKIEARAIVPFETLATNHILVEALLNDKGPYHLIFDLGAPITLLSNRVSEAAGIVKANAPRSFLFGMRGEAEVGKLQVGKLTATKLPVIVLDHPVLKALEDMTGRRIDGLMGFTFFARYKTTIDYHAHQMTFEAIDYEIRDLLKELPDRLLGPKVLRERVLAPGGLWGLRVSKPVNALNSHGVPIAEVFGGSPAARAGLKPGDVIITLDGRWTTSIVDVFQAAGDIAPGQEATIVVQRDGKEQSFTLRPSDGA
jgi:PDZ domain/Aspartyl protease